MIVWSNSAVFVQPSQILTNTFHSCTCNDCYISWEDEDVSIFFFSKRPGKILGEGKYKSLATKLNTVKPMETCGVQCSLQIFSNQLFRISVHKGEGNLFQNKTGAEMSRKHKC